MAWDEVVFRLLAGVSVGCFGADIITRLWEKYRGYRNSEARSESGAGAVQGAQGGSGGAKPDACPSCSHSVAGHTVAGQVCSEIGCYCGMNAPLTMPTRYPTLNLNGATYGGQRRQPVGDGVKVESQDTEIIAWRAWYLVEHEGDWYLRSFFCPEGNPMRWEGPAVRADKTPELESAHGIYALTEKRFGSVCYEDVYSMIGGDGRYKAEGYIYGEIALSGTVIEGTNGYRAEQAVVRSLTLKLDKAWALTSKQVPLEIQASLERRYQCPVTLDVGEVAA